MSQYRWDGEDCIEISDGQIVGRIEAIAGYKMTTRALARLPVEKRLRMPLGFRPV